MLYFRYQAEVEERSISCDLFSFSTTESIKPNFLASSAVIKLSRSRASEISLIDLPVCLEYILFSLSFKDKISLA